MVWRGICWIAVVTFGSSQQGLRSVHSQPVLAVPGYRSFLAGADAGLDPVAEALVHVAPVTEGALQDRLGHAVEQVADDVADQPLAGSVIEDLADHRSRLAPVIVGLAQSVGGTDHVAVGVPVVGLVV